LSTAKPRFNMHTDDRTRGPLDIVIIDDDADHAELVTQVLQRSSAAICPDGIRISVYRDPIDALSATPVGSCITLCDYCLSGSCALDWMSDFIRSDCGPVILMTSSGSENIAASAFRQGAADYIIKSDFFAQPELLIRSIRESLRRHRLERRNLELSRALKLLNTELQVKNETLAHITETAHRFVDDVAHEFRTPLAVIQEFASIISDGIGGTVTPRQSEFLVHIGNATRDLAGLVDDFLDTSRLRAQTLRVDRAEHDIAGLFDLVRPALTLRASSKGIRLTENIEGNLRPVFIDLEKAGRVVTNLAINAIKFSPPGSEIVLSARASGPDDIEVAITDFGPGISPADIEAIFNRFVQTDRARRPGVKGFGLGLSIAGELVHLNLGQLNVRSELGRTTTFSFTVPVSDRAALMERHLARISSENRGGHVTMLRANLVDASQSLEDARGELVSLCKSWDLVLPEPESNSLLLVGPTADPDLWVARLQSELASAADALELSRKPLRLSVVKCWVPPAAPPPVRIGGTPSPREVARAA